MYSEEKFKVFNTLMLVDIYIYKADSTNVPSQWDTSLQSTAVSHWLRNLESALYIYIYIYIYIALFLIGSGSPVVRCQLLEPMMMYCQINQKE